MSNKDGPKIYLQFVNFNPLFANFKADSIVKAHLNIRHLCEFVFRVFYLTLL